MLLTCRQASPMVTDPRVRRLRKLMQTNRTMAEAAAKAEMDEIQVRDVRRYGRDPIYRPFGDKAARECDRSFPSARMVDRSCCLPPNSDTLI